MTTGRTRLCSGLPRVTAGRSRLCSRLPRVTTGSTRIPSSLFPALLLFLSGLVLAAGDSTGSGDHTLLPTLLPTVLPPPELILEFNIESLSQLNPAPAENPFSTVTGLAAGNNQILLSFANTYITLGPLFQITAHTASVLFNPLEFPPHFTTSNILLNNREEIVLFDRESGDILFIQPLAGTHQKYSTNLKRTDTFSGITGGGVALLKGRELNIFLRRQGDLKVQTIKLPFGIYTAMASDREGNLWLYDSASRVIHILDSTGKERGVIRPKLLMAEMPLPQTLQVYPDGSFLLGGSGKLRKFTPQGQVLWQLDSIPGVYSEALPPLFQAILDPYDNSFLLLDLPANRILKFREKEAADRAADDIAGSDIDGQLSAMTRGFRSGLPGCREKLIDLCLENDLYLLAGQYLVSQSVRDSHQEFIERATAFALASMALKVEKRLLLPKADKLYGAALAIFRRLNLNDPVNPGLPELIRGLKVKRKEIRGSLYQEEFISLKKDSSGALWLENLSARKIDDLALTYNLGGLTTGPAHYYIGDLQPHRKIRLDLPEMTELLNLLNRQELAEDLHLRLALLARFTAAGEAQVNYTSIDFPLNVE
ncbi:hypothetical protein ES705_26676 [subsurface metagenome]